MLPSSRFAASSLAPISLRLSSRFLNGITEVWEMTLSERIFASWAITSSVIPSAKNSFSGSALKLRNGSTATEGDLAMTGAVSAAIMAAPLGKRSAGTFASAFLIASSTDAGTAGLKRRIEGRDQ